MVRFQCKRKIQTESDIKWVWFQLWLSRRSWIGVHQLNWFIAQFYTNKLIMSNIRHKLKLPKAVNFKFNILLSGGGEDTFDVIFNIFLNETDFREDAENSWSANNKMRELRVSKERKYMKLALHLPSLPSTSNISLADISYFTCFSLMWNFRKF
jgi:hypothetical protein